MKFVDVLKKVRNVFEWFLIYSICGWIYEVVWWMMIEENLGFINRGFLFGPWLPIYGAGMLIFLLIIKLLKVKNTWLVFGIGLVVSTGAELLGSYIMQWTCGYFMWDYSDMFLNFQGRIALKTSLYFALLILLAVKVIQPNMEKFQKKFDGSVVHNVICGLFAAAFAVDGIYSLITKL